MSIKKSATTLILSICFVAMLSILATAQQKRRIAVVDFDYSTTTNYEVYVMYGSAANLSKDMSDLIVNRLQQLGTYELVERQQLLKIMEEQNFALTGRVDDKTAAEFGRLLGVQGLVIGSVKSISYKPPKKSSLLDRLRRNLPFGEAINLRLKDAQASVAITFRLVNTTTGAIVLAGDYVGEASDKKTVINPEGVLGVDSDDKEVAKFLLRGAIADVVGKIALQIEQNPNALPQPVTVVARQATPQPQPSGSHGASGNREAPGANVPEPKAPNSVNAIVIEAKAGAVTISIGENAGVKVGDRFDVSRIKQIPDPNNPGAHHILADKIGSLVIMKVYETAAVGRYTGTRPATVKDRVTPKQ